MPEEQDRQRLAAMQSHVAASLTNPSDYPPPPAFDGNRLRLAASMLRGKRRKTLAYLLPCLLTFLGGDFDNELSAYADGSSGPPREGTMADAIAFARFVAARRGLPPDAARELLRMELGTRRFAWVRSENPRHLLVGFRLFRRRVRFLHVPSLPSRGMLTSASSRTP